MLRNFFGDLDLEPDNKWGYRYLAQLYDYLGRSEEARPLFEHVRQLDPNPHAAAGERPAGNQLARVLYDDLHPSLSPAFYSPQWLFCSSRVA